MAEARANIPALIATKTSKKVIKGKPITISVALESEYYKLLKTIVETIKTRFENIVLNGLDVNHIKEQFQDESYSSRINRLVNEFRSSINSQFDKARLFRLSKLIIGKADKAQLRKLKQSLGFGIDIADIPEFKGYRNFINAQIRQNLTLITSLKQESLNRLEKTLRLQIQQGKTINEIAKEISKSGEVNKKHAVLIARNEIKNVTGALTTKRLVNAGIDTYVWSTSRDERVRGNPSGRYPNSKPSHYAMEGKVCRFDDPTVYLKKGVWVKRLDLMPIGNPMQDINCRCDYLPYIDLSE